MEARPNPTIKPSGRRAWIVVAVISGSLGALVAILAMAVLTPQLSPLLRDAVPFFKQRSSALTESPAAIMRWYRQFDAEAEAQVAAAERYYDRYVEWELMLEQVQPVSAYAQTRLEDPGAPADDPPYAIWAFFVDPSDVVELREEGIVAVRGKVVFINASNIFLGDCQMLTAKDG
jgi:hypothetical protein